MAGGGTTRAWVALGSNLGDRDAALALAVRGLDEPEDCRVVECSGVYETDPVGPGDQSPYLNAVVELRTTRSPHELLALLQQIEARVGRTRRAGEPRWGPRLLDLDLLLFGDDAECVVDSADLVVPHPRLAERAFVLVPLAELAGGRVHPVLGRSIADLLAGLPGAREDGLPRGVRRWERCLRVAP